MFAAKLRYFCNVIPNVIGFLGNLATFIFVYNKAEFLSIA